MKLATDPFNKIAYGQKTIESRLFDEKRQLIQIGDEIIFNENSDSGRSIRTTVTNLFRYPTFAELFTQYPPKQFGGGNIEELLAEIKQFYSDEDEQLYGVVGIQLKLFEATLVD